MKITIIFLLIITILLLTSCATPDALPRYQQSRKVVVNDNTYNDGINYYHDIEHKVGIWTYKYSSYGIAMAVIPDSEYNSK